MKKTILIVVILLVVGGLYWANSTSNQSANENNPTLSGVDETISPIISTTTKSYTLAEVAKHGKDGDCWTTVNGKVYDLTTWPAKHPGGDKAIFAICGIDGTKAYEKAHAGQSKPANTLDGFYIGDLAK
jgi:cytochrome b involved in lipid metabolism